MATRKFRKINLRDKKKVAEELANINSLGAVKPSSRS